MRSSSCSSLARGGRKRPIGAGNTCPLPAHSEANSKCLLLHQTDDDVIMDARESSELFMELLPFLEFGFLKFSVCVLCICTHTFMYSYVHTRGAQMIRIIRIMSSHSQRIAKYPNKVRPCPIWAY